MSKWRTRQELFATIPLRSYVTFCLGVACTFAAVGVVGDLFNLEHTDTHHLVLTVLTTSCFSVLWVVVVHRRSPKLIIPLAVAQVLWLVASARLFPAPHQVLSLSEWRTHVAFHAFLIIVLVLFSYGWFGTFIRMEGKRYFAAHTEIELASRIQAQLVPPVEMRTRDFEIYGISIPSGIVGGDLIDMVETNGAVCAYLADVAGHGVGAGVLMSMVKTAVRMHLMTNAETGKGLLEAVNNTLAPMTEQSAYATFAYVLIKPGMPLTYSIAAHSPIFHLQRESGMVVRHSVDNLPVAMFPDVLYATSKIDVQRGDLLAIVTDGLTEIADSHNVELGESYIENALIRYTSRPLDEIAEEIFTTTRAFGKAQDDQSLLLLRWSEN